ncbi:HTH-type transcriptional activator RhaS [subsurface metagenome]
MGANTQKIQEDSLSSYIPRGQNVLQRIFKEHFDDFRELYDEKYAKNYGTFRLARITEVVDEFIKCGHYSKGLARVKCVNPDCGNDYFVPLSCLSFYLCPSCHQKRTLLFGEQMANEVLLKIPHRQFVFAIPKCLRPYFIHNRTLFSDISHLIFDLSNRKIDQSINYMLDNLENRLSLKQLANNAHLSVSQYTYLFKIKTGYPPIEYFIRLKIQKACQYLDITDMKIYNISQIIGYDDPYYFSRIFHSIIGISPQEFRKRKMS